MRGWERRRGGWRGRVSLSSPHHLHVTDMVRRMVGIVQLGALL
jgi:hypothetical protein